MTRVVKVSQGDYRIQVQNGGNIYLDTGSGGLVTVVGNLDVKGTTTTIESTNSTIKDNIIQLNYGQTGNGISAALNYVSGIEVERGNYSAAQFLFNEQLNHWDTTVITTTATATISATNSIVLTSVNGVVVGSSIQFSGTPFGGISTTTTYYVLSINGFDITVGLSSTGTPVTFTDATGSIAAIIDGREIAGSWVAQTADGKLSGVIAASFLTANGNDLAFDMQNSGAHVIVANAYGYENNVVNPNTLVTKQWVDNYIKSGVIVPGQADVTQIYYSPNGGITIDSRATATANQLDFYIAEQLRGYFSSTGFQVDNVNIYLDTIKNTSTSGNLKLTATDGNVEIQGYLNLDDQSATPLTVPGVTKIYSQSGTGPTPGKTGIYFTNDVSTDELVSKNRALLFSMLF